MSIEEIREKYKPKEGLVIHAFQSTQTGNYIALVSEKIIVNRRKKEDADASKKLISEKDINKYFEQLKPYLDERVKTT